MAYFWVNVRKNIFLSNFEIWNRVEGCIFFFCFKTPVGVNAHITGHMFHCKLSWELLICNEWEVMARPASFLNFFFHFRSLLPMLMFLGVGDNQTVFTFIETLFFFLGGGGGEGRGTLKKFIRHELLVLCLLSWMEAYRPPAKERRVNFFCLSFWEVFKLQWYAFNRSELVNLKKRVGNKLLNFVDRTNSRQQNMWDCCCL